MFKPVPMLRLDLLVLQRDERAVLCDLAEAGAVQLEPAQSASEPALLPRRDCAAELAHCARLLARSDALRNSLPIANPAPIPTVLPETTLDELEEKLPAMEQRVAALLQLRQLLQQRGARLTALCEQVSGYRGLDLPLAPPDRYSFLHFVTGTMPTENFERLEREGVPDVVWLPLKALPGRQRLVAITSRQNRAALDEALLRAAFQRDSLPVVAGATAESFCEDQERERALIATELETAEASLRSLAQEYAAPLALVAEQVKREQNLLAAEQSLPRTRESVLIPGWVPAADVSALERRVQQITGARAVIHTTTADALPQEHPPVLLRHSRVLRPFEMLVAAYGAPEYHEVEPTLFVALSYVLMFGMMFGDAGHGAILALGGLTTLVLSHRQKLRDMAVLLLFGGLSSMGFGLIYGSCFGLEAFRKYALWHDPLEGNPMVLMYAAIGIGIVLISLGLILNIINRFQRGDVLGGLLDKFGLVGMLFYWGTLALATQYQAFQSHGLGTLALLLFLGLPMMGWAIKEPLEYWLHRRSHQSADAGEGLWTALIESLVGVFEAALSYLANTISFVRLAAYAMSHAALLVAAFMLADAVRHLPAGDILSVLVIILGNLVALVLEGIIASVQALRLEYYEFFGKFFSGSGQAFKPFRLTTHPAA